MSLRGLRALAALSCAALFATAPACRRQGAATPDELRAEIARLERERDALRERIGELLPKDPRISGMPRSEVRFGVPTPLARTLIEKVIAGFVDQVELELRDLKVHKAGRVRKLVTLGEYVLDVRIERVSGRLRTGQPDIRFGGNQVTVALPVEVVSGTGDATIDFAWDGRNVAGMLCGDMQIRQQVAGSVKPDSYPLRGGLELQASAREILAAPRFPALKVRLTVEPSTESWAAVQKILEEKQGVCGFVLDKVDIRGVLEGLIAKGFNVRLPTEKLKPVAIPVGIEPTMTIRGKPITLDLTVGGLAITEHMLWLGADVEVETPIADAAGLAPPPAATRARLATD